MITGQCLCGAVRYETAEQPITTRICWCSVCQKFAGGNGAVNVCFPTAGFRITGDLADYQSIADSGNRMHRRFCPKCGVHMFSEAEARPHLIFVRAGTLDEPMIPKPAATIWTKSAPPWAAIDENLPKFEGQPPPAG